MPGSPWQSRRLDDPLRNQGWLHDLEPLTTGMLSQKGSRWWTWNDQNALGLRSGAVLYPVFPTEIEAPARDGLREILSRISLSWCIIGPAIWTDRVLPFLPPSRILQTVSYDFMSRPALPIAHSEHVGRIRWGRDGEGDALFALQEAYEKEEVLFDPREFQPLASRLHFWQTLREQLVASLWIDGRPVAKAGTNALTRAWAQVGGVFTVPAFRRQGLQQVLMVEFLNRLADEGRGACLFVKKENAPARRLYQRLGFSTLGDFTILYGERRG